MIPKGVFLTRTPLCYKADPSFKSTNVILLQLL